MAIEHSGTVWLTDRTFLKMHVTFCEYLVNIKTTMKKETRVVCIFQLPASLDGMNLENKVQRKLLLLAVMVVLMVVVVVVMVVMVVVVVGV